MIDCAFKYRFDEPEDESIPRGFGNLIEKLSSFRTSLQTLGTSHLRHYS